MVARDVLPVANIDGVVAPLSARQNLACKALDQLTITAAVSTETMVNALESGVRWFLTAVEEVEARGVEVSETNARQTSTLKHTSVIVINESLTNPATALSLKQALGRLEAAIGTREAERMNVYILHLHSSLPASLTSESVDASSRMCTEYVDCERDLEWALASMMHRIAHVICTSARLQFSVVGSGELSLDSDTCGEQASTEPSDHLETNESVQLVDMERTTVIRYGVCDRSDTLIVSGSFVSTADSQGFSTPAPFVEVVFVYRSSEYQLQAARVSIRLHRDLTNETHVARIERNDKLMSGHDSSSALLLEQRRELMYEKALFHTRTTTRAVAELENAFKRVSIMKEELWARRKWIVNRGLRGFEEHELARLEHEAATASTALQRRVDRLGAKYAVNARENSRGGGTPSTQRVRTDEYIRALKRSSIDSETQEGDDADRHEATPEVVQQKLQKQELQLDLATAELRGIESRLEDLQHSVRISQTKGSVVMNDTRKAWIVLFADAVASKRKLLALARAKAHTAFSLAVAEHKEETASSTLSDIKRVNSALLRLEKEQAKRKKRTFLCMKEMVGVMRLEAEAATELEFAGRCARQCELFRSPALDDRALFRSCIHVCFPLDLSRTRDASAARNGHLLSNAVHSLLFGLRHFCHGATLAPFSSRIAQQESFLWLDHEQRPALGLSRAGNELSADAKHAELERESWAVIVVSYNALFSSPTAVVDVTRVLSIAEEAGKPVLHVELEPPLANFDEFRVWEASSPESVVASQANLNDLRHRAAPVKKQYLVWKHHYGLVKAMLDRISTAPVLQFTPSVRECSRCSVPNGGGGSFLPCVPCCCAAITRSTHCVSVNSDGGTPDSVIDNKLRQQTAFVQTVSAIGHWIDGLVQSAAQLAVRSHNLDPRSLSVLFTAVELHWTDEVRARTLQWEDSFTHRRTETSRQVLKLFKVMDDEASELVQLQRMLETRKQSLVAACTDRISRYRDEQKLIKSIADSRARGERSETAMQRKEHALMVEEEMAQTLSEADLLSNAIERLGAQDSGDDEVSAGSAEKQLEELSQRFQVALRRSVVRILELGKVRTANQLQEQTKRFAEQQECDELERLDARCAFGTVRLGRNATAPDQPSSLLTDWCLNLLVLSARNRESGGAVWPGTRCSGLYNHDEEERDRCRRHGRGGGVPVGEALGLLRGVDRARLGRAAKARARCR